MMCEQCDDCEREHASCERDADPLNDESEPSILASFCAPRVLRRFNDQAHCVLNVAQAVMVSALVGAQRFQVALEVRLTLFQARDAFPLWLQRIYSPGPETSMNGPF